MSSHRMRNGYRYDEHHPDIHERVSTENAYKDMEAFQLETDTYPGIYSVSKNFASGLSASKQLSTLIQWWIRLTTDLTP